MDLQGLVADALVGAALFVVLARGWRRWKTKDTGGSCAGCGGCGAAPIAQAPALIQLQVRRK